MTIALKPLSEDDHVLTEPDLDIDPLEQDSLPQVKIPFEATVGGQTMPGVSLSLTKALVEGTLPQDLEYQDALISLRFDFDGFSITLFADVILSGDVAGARDQVALYFLQPADAHLGPLRYLINSFLAGDTVAIGALLHASPQTEAPAKGAKVIKRKGLRWQALLLAFLGAGLVASASFLVFQRLVLSYEPAPIVFQRPYSALRAPTSGQIVALDLRAAQGEVAVSLLSASGNLVTLRQPCACNAETAPDVFEGAGVLSGEPILRLSDPEASLVAQTRLSTRGLARFFAKDDAQIQLQNGDVLGVSVTLDPSEKTTATVAWPTDVAQPADGTIARLRFSRFTLPSLSDLSSKLSKVFNNIGK